jgi:hypothetical protein
MAAWSARHGSPESDGPRERWPPCAGRLGFFSPKASSRLTFRPAAIKSASAFTFWSPLSLNCLILCQSLASLNNGSTHTLRLRRAFS